MVDHLHVRDVDYDTFYKRKQLEDDTNISRRPIDVQKVVMPNWTDKTVLDATATQKAPANLDIGGTRTEEMPEDNDEFIKRNISSKGDEKCRSVAAPIHKVVDSDNVEREAMKTHQDNVEVNDKLYLV